MLADVDAALHRIEALAGEGRHAVTFRRADGSEQAAVVHVTDGGLDVAAASLPPGCQPGSPEFAALVDAVSAFERARRQFPVAAALRDIAGGWDVSMGNVVLAVDGRPTCTAHGEMAEQDGVWVCGVCAARALLG
jgi:hypothetical protein